jgi:hypothetical protein
MNNLEKLKKTKFLRKLYTIQSEISEHCDGIKHVNIPNIKIIISKIFDKYEIKEYTIEIDYNKDDYIFYIKTKYNLLIKIIIMNDGISI